MIYIKYSPCGMEKPVKINKLETAAFGKTYEEALGSLISGINNDEIDTENNFLIIYSENDKRTRNSKSQA